MKRLKCITKIFFRTVFVILAHGKVISVSKGITILDNRIKEGTVISRYKLRSHLEWCDSPWLEEFCIFCNQFISILAIFFNKILEVWETFIDNLWVQCFSSRKCLVKFLIWTFNTDILVIRCTYWYPNTKITSHINSSIPLDFISTERQVSFSIGVFNFSSCCCIIFVSDNSLISTKK